jgi:hypothetical protein
MHVIRLRGPWELAPLDGSASSVRAEVPGDLGSLLGDGFIGPARLLRRFNTPTNLDPNERVYLIFADLDPAATLTLNGAPLPRPLQQTSLERHDITAALKTHNVVEIQLPLPCPPLGEVTLEISAS